MTKVTEIIREDKLARQLGIEVAGYSPGYAELRMRITTDHLNATGAVHGGAIFTLADTACAVASNTHEGTAVLINASISYYQASTEGTLYATAKEVFLNRRLGSYAVEISDDNKKTIASFQGMVYRKNA